MQNTDHSKLGIKETDFPSVQEQGKLTMQVAIAIVHSFFVNASIRA